MSEIRNALRNRIKNQVNWFITVELKQDGERLTLAVPSQFLHDWLIGRYKDDVQEAAESIGCTEVVWESAEAEPVPSYIDSVEPYEPEEEPLSLVRQSEPEEEFSVDEEIGERAINDMFS